MEEAIKPIILREHLFFSVDKVLPRKLARLPYLEAFRSLHSKLSSTLPQLEVWYRNSVLEGNFVFGVSDLDITVMSHDKLSEADFYRIRLALTETKNLYPFLGETNFYVKPSLNQFSESANRYELLRDPHLLNRAGLKPGGSDVDAIVFTLRMLYADYLKLRDYPHLRQKKWHKHFENCFPGVVPGDATITIDTVIKVLQQRIAEPELLKEINLTLELFKEANLTGDKVFSMKLPFLWKFLFPHRHIWFHENNNEDIGLIRGTSLASICLRQIDWEVWGLLGQYPFLPDREFGFKIHLERLAKVAGLIDEKATTADRARELSLSCDKYFN